jgi:DNA modification methylase
MCKPMLWFVKGKEKLVNLDIDNYIESTTPDKDKHPWAQSSVEAEYLIKNLTSSDDSVVVDPFLGSGEFAIPAIKLKRWFIGIEIDKKTFEHAKNNLMMETAPPNKESKSSSSPPSTTIAATTSDNMHTIAYGVVGDYAPYTLLL